MSKRLLLGDEALAQAAIDAGISTAYAYPGTPSTEIFEYVERVTKKDELVYATWAANEKVAYEEAMGTSYAGRRTLVVMKHVGLNVAADPFMNSAITGADGGVVLAVADDPSMHSSQNEQDSRYYADFAMVPCFEPANQQEAYDMTRQAYDVSERFKLPAMLRLVTRLAHSRADVEVAPRRAPNALAPSTDPGRWTLLPTNSRVNYKALLEKQAALAEFSEACEANELVLNPARKDLGVITSGVAYNYFREVAGDDAPSYLKVGLYPLPMKKIRALMAYCERVIIVEEGYPFIERTLLGALGVEDNAQFMGRASGHVPRYGELNPDRVSQALGLGAAPQETKDEAVRARPPQLCPGCPHADTFRAINTARERFDGSSRVFSDIGCYTLGYYPPYETIESCLDMGASIGMAKGASDAGVFPSYCVIGDSTFGHSGITPLLSAAYDNTNMVVFIVDNGTVAMTGTQDSMSTGDRLDAIVKGVGVDPAHIRVINPLPKHHDENVKVILEETAYEGLSVIIPRRPCVQIRKKG